MIDRPLRTFAGHPEPLGPLSLDPTLDPLSLKAAFARFGRLHVPGFLTEDAAARLHALLASERDWICSTIGGGVVADVPVEMIEGLSPADRAAVFALAHREAERGFHYMFDTVRISTPIEKDQPLPDAWRQVAAFLNGPAFLGFVRTLTGDPRCAYVDAQATRYTAGHYLTEHDDEKPSAGRLYAYVLNLTPDWRTDWGGLLAFIDEDDHVAEAYRPSYNALNIFRVPQRHAVSFVAPFAAAPRLSITGWIRDAVPAGLS
ncbi:2OG-Fe(II) oxygenase family protein [Brevundimonas staleyi]|uniref:2OG-Fe(II) oxygenase n=1 Tax=Brevundimonas staleyi TaxID=74326 RepID=A0ABW0FTH5_9CAUL